MAHKPWLTLAALVAAPLMASAIVTACAGVIYVLPDQQPLTSSMFMLATGLYPIAAALALIASLTLGSAIHSHLRTRHIVDIVSYVACAFAAGALVSFVSLAFLPWHIVLWGLPAAALSGLFLWLIRRPDRDAANPATPAP